MSSSPSFTVADLAMRIGARLCGDGSRIIRGLAAVEQAGAQDLTFISKAKYAEQWRASQAAAAVVADNLTGVMDADGNTPASNPRPTLYVKDVDAAMITLLDLFAPTADLPALGIHDTAVVDADATISATARIGAYVVVGRRCVIADDVVLHPGVRLSADVAVGRSSVLHANVVVRERCVIGERVIIHQNASIGADGFGYRPGKSASGQMALFKMHHIGNVVIENDVEIGAGTCVDRGKFGSTVIGEGTKIDNLCQVGHNVRIGKCCAIAALTGISGSAVIGDGCMIGGQVGVIDHAHVGPGVQIAAQAGVCNDIEPNSRIAGSPAMDAGTAIREWTSMRKLPALVRQMAQLSKQTGDATPHKAD